MDGSIHDQRSGARWSLAAAALTGAALGASLLRRRRRASFRDRVVLIAGGSRGLGLELARRFAAEGARLALLARDPDELRRAEGILRREGAAGEVLLLPADATRREEVERAVGRCVARFGALDVLVNLAGAIVAGPLGDTTEEDLRRSVDTHLYAPYHAVTAARPALLRSPLARVVNVASIGGLVAVPHLLAYSASKHALVGLSKGMRSELARDGIRVTTVCPGLMRTGSPYQVLVRGRAEREFPPFVLMDSLPGASVSARSAARRIVEACRRGDAMLVFPLYARAAAALERLAPEASARAWEGVARLLPREVGADRGVRGADVDTAWAPSPLTALTDRAARRNNERLPRGRPGGARG